MHALTILVVDDFAQWRLTVRSILEEVPGFRIIDEAENALEGIRKAAQLLPDVVLLDIGLPFLNGIEAAPRFRRVSPNSKIVFLTQERDAEVMCAALASGAEAYLLKSQAARELRPTIEAMRGVHSCSVLNLGPALCPA